MLIFNVVRSINLRFTLLNFTPGNVGLFLRLQTTY